MSKSPPDVSAELARQVKKARPWAIAALLVTAAVLVAAFVVAAVTGAEENLTWIMVPAMIILVVSSVPLFRASRCPHCRRFLGRNLGRFCPNCGARIRAEKK